MNFTENDQSPQFEEGELVKSLENKSAESRNATLDLLKACIKWCTQHPDIPPMNMFLHVQALNYDELTRLLRYEGIKGLDWGKTPFLQESRLSELSAALRLSAATASTSDTALTSATNTFTNQQRVIVGIPKSLSKIYIFDLDTIIDERSVDIREMIPDVYTQVIAYRHKLYFIGGRTSKSFRCYNIVTSEWSVLADATCSGYGRALCILDDYIYAVGGVEDKNGILVYHSLFARYSILEDRWEDLGSQLNRSGLCSLSCTARNELIVSGGWDGEGALCTIDMVDLMTGSWKRIGRMITPRHSHFTCIFEQKLFIFGGIIYGKFKAKPFIEVFDIRKGQSSYVEEFHIPRFTRFFDSMTTRIVGNTVYIYDGEYGINYTDDVFVFNLKTTETRKFTVKGLGAAKLLYICGTSL